MQVPLEIAFLNIEPSAALEAEIRRRAAMLERFGADIVSCRVTVEAPNKHHRHGGLYRVSVDIHIPGEEILANRNAAAQHTHEDAYLAVRDAFRAARRQLQDAVRVRRGDVKTHKTPARKAD